MQDQVYKYREQSGQRGEGEGVGEGVDKMGEEKWEIQASR